MATVDRDAALEALSAAFDAVRLEDGVSIHEADVIDDYGGKEERVAARALDTAVDWKDVPAQDLQTMYWVWSYFDAKGFRFYLPAILAWWMQAKRSPDLDSTAMCSMLLGLKDKGEFRSLFEERVRLLSNDQIEATCQCLNWIANEDRYFQTKARRVIRVLRRLQAWRKTQPPQSLGPC